MKTLIIILLALVAIYIVWRVIFGENFNDRRNQRLALEYVEDNIFRLSNIIDAINHCETADELRSIEKWVNDKADLVATQIGSEVAFFIDGLCGMRVSMGLIKTVKEKYDEKLNSL